ncbi:MAG: TIGR02206 family membrane protein [Acidobacteria bacterium]|nr:TIGR02206 family membrane protein [Acidobacteriota bacterium]
MTAGLFLNVLIVNLQPLILAASFLTFGTQHLVVLGIIAAVCTLLLRTAKDCDPVKRRWLGRILGMLLLGYVTCIYVQQGFARMLSWEYSLPLDLCNLVLAACIIALFRPSRFIYEIAYFWGLGGGLQALLTPDLARGFPSWDFVLFFWGHGATLLAIAFFISDPNFMPRKNNILRMMIALNVYAVVVGAINAIAGWNYGYLCRKPAMPSLLDFLGPWPLYLLSLEAVAFLTFLILDLVWRLLVWSRRSGNGIAVESRK